MLSLAGCERLLCNSLCFVHVPCAKLPAKSAPGVCCSAGAVSASASAVGAYDSGGRHAPRGRPGTHPQGSQRSLERSRGQLWLRHAHALIAAWHGDNAGLLGCLHPWWGLWHHQRPSGVSYVGLDITHNPEHTPGGAEVGPARLGGAQKTLPLAEGWAGSPPAPPLAGVYGEKGS
jgi:hypothetical protein